MNKNAYKMVIFALALLTFIIFLQYSTVETPQPLVTPNNMVVDVDNVEDLSVFESKNKQKLGIIENGFVYSIVRHPKTLLEALSVTYLVAYHDNNSETKGVGTGWLVDFASFGLHGCYIVTNSHVVNAGANVPPAVNRIYVTSFKNVNAEGTKQPSKVVYDDKSADIAILNIANCAGLPRFKLSHGTKQSTPVYALGNPRALVQSVTEGVVSFIDRYVDAFQAGYVYIQTDAPINPGNSGGPLVDAKTFEVIGMNSMVMLHKTGRDGLGFAVTAGTISQAAINLKELSRPSYPIFGFGFASISDDLARSFNMSASVINTCKGIIVNRIANDGSVKDAGLLNGDIIFSINIEGQVPVCTNSSADLFSFVTKSNSKDLFTFAIGRYDPDTARINLFEFTISANDRYKALTSPRFDGNENARVYRGHLGFEISNSTSFPTDKWVVTKVYQFSEAFWSQALVATKNASILSGQRTRIIVKPVLKSSAATSLDADGFQVMSFQTIEAVRDTNGRVLASITKDSLENFASESADTGAKIVIDMRLHVLKASDYAGRNWVENKDPQLRSVIFSPTKYIAP